MQWDIGLPSNGTTPWQRWFAWHPVRVGVGQRAWLEVVERQRTFYVDHEYVDISQWSYRTVER